uniref:DUF2341 domain-containing protein n=1 Tax=Dulem virus 75 TaxID=3145786 RepID=A0AAU8B6C7_9VIRU
MFLFGVTVPYSRAVTPQEGWYIAGETTSDVSGKSVDYWIIDNKPNLTPWFFDLDGYFLPTTQLNSSSTVYAYLGERWFGYSYYPWLIDSDWVFRIWINSATVPNGSTSFFIYFFDKSRILQYYVSDSGEQFSGTTTDNIFVSKNAVGITSSTGDLPYTDWSYFSADTFKWTNYTIPSDPLTMSTLDNTNINDLVICAAPQTGGEKYHAKVQMAIQFMCPKDKAPDGMAIGDEWPKLRTMQVEIAGGLTEWAAPYYEALQSESLITDPSEVSHMKGALSSHLDSAIGLPDIDTDLDTSAISSMMVILGPIKQIFPWLIAGLFVIVVIRRGVT